MLWSATLPPDTPLSERIEAAAACAYSELSLFPADYAREGFAPAAARELRLKADDRGVRLSVMDALTEWYPYDRSRSYRGRPPTTAEEAFAAAEAFGCAYVSAIPYFPTDLDIAGFAEHFASLCDRAAERGLAAELEFTPLPPGRGLRWGWDVVRTADRPEAGLVFDSWHFFRSDPDFDLLAQIPGERITGVQISDGAPEIRESLVKDTYFSRLHAGEGSFDLKRLITTLHRQGALNGLGPEVLSREQHALTPIEGARKAAEALDKFLAETLDLGGTAAGGAPE